MRLGKLLAHGRVNRDLTPAELAEAIGIKTRTLAAIERGGDCDGPTLIKIMAWLTEDVGQERSEAVLFDAGGAPQRGGAPEPVTVARGVVAK